MRVHYHSWWPCQIGRNTFSNEYSLNQQEDFPPKRNVHHGGMAKTVSTRDAGERQRKRRPAIECGESDEGLPAIDVIVNVGWSTRSNHHRNLSGMHNRP